MKNHKNKLSHAQFDILRKQNKSKLATEDWLKSTGLNTATFNNIHSKLLQAQKTAHTLLTQHQHLLTAEQTKILRNFKRKIGNTKLCTKLSPKSAYPVLNISNKINRQLFKLNKQLTITGTE